MVCVTPLAIENKGEREPGKDRYINVPCGKCPNCNKRTALTWVFRLLQEELVTETAYFVTYTYDDEHLPISENGYPTLDRKHHQLYMKRLRKHLDKKGYDVKLRFFMCGEYGGQTNRPHYHAILFNLPEKYEVNEHLLTAIWKHGRVQVDLVSEKSIAYVCGYVNKQTYWHNLGENDDRVREFRNMSQKLGINYLSDAKIKSMQEKLQPYLTLSDGQKMGIPRYYKEKVFNRDERDYLALISENYMEENPIFASTKEKNDFLNMQKKPKN